MKATNIFNVNTLLFVILLSIAHVRGSWWYSTPTDEVKAVQEEAKATELQKGRTWAQFAYETAGSLASAVSDVLAVDDDSDSETISSDDEQTTKPPSETDTVSESESESDKPISAANLYKMSEEHESGDDEQFLSTASGGEEHSSGANFKVITETFGILEDEQSQDQESIEDDSNSIARSEDEETVLSSDEDDLETIAISDESDAELNATLTSSTNSEVLESVIEETVISSDLKPAASTSTDNEEDLEPEIEDPLTSSESEDDSEETVVSSDNEIALEETEVDSDREQISDTIVVSDNEEDNSFLGLAASFFNNISGGQFTDDYYEDQSDEVVNESTTPTEPGLLSSAWNLGTSVISTAQKWKSALLPKKVDRVQEAEHVDLDSGTIVTTVQSHENAAPVHLDQEIVEIESIDNPPKPPKLEIEILSLLNQPIPVNKATMEAFTFVANALETTNDKEIKANIYQMLQGILNNFNFKLKIKYGDQISVIEPVARKTIQYIDPDDQNQPQLRDMAKTIDGLTQKMLKAIKEGSIVLPGNIAPKFNTLVPKITPSTFLLENGPKPHTQITEPANASGDSREEIVIDDDQAETGATSTSTSTSSNIEPQGTKIDSLTLDDQLIPVKESTLETLAFIVNTMFTTSDQQIQEKMSSFFQGILNFYNIKAKVIDNGMEMDFGPDDRQSIEDSYLKTKDMKMPALPEFAAAIDFMIEKLHDVIMKIANKTADDELNQLEADRIIDTVAGSQLTTSHVDSSEEEAEDDGESQTSDVDSDHEHQQTPAASSSNVQSSDTGNSVFGYLKGVYNRTADYLSSFMQPKTKVSDSVTVSTTTIDSGADLSSGSDDNDSANGNVDPSDSNVQDNEEEDELVEFDFVYDKGPDSFDFDNPNPPKEKEKETKKTEEKSSSYFWPMAIGIGAVASIFVFIKAALNKF